jgi:hypothetical protein
MATLFAEYSLSQIIIFLIAIVVFLKGGWDLIDFFKGKYKDKFNKDYNQKEKEKELEQHYEACKEQHVETLETYNRLEDKIDNISESVSKLSDEVQRLTISDKNDIKQFIVREYHYFVEQKKWIDDYSLDCILLRYEDYKAEGGNSYIKTLIEELKALPKCPPANT